MKGNTCNGCAFYRSSCGSLNNKGLDDICIIPEDYFPEVKWEDEEPRELILKPIE